MDVFLVPVRPTGQSGTPEFALYCEPAPEPVEPEVVGAGVAKPGLFARLARSFRQALAEGEAERRRQEAGHPETAGGSRVGRFIKRKLADSVAEHRLLWALRHHTQARLVHPDLVPADRALAWAMGEFRKDLKKHGFWCVVDGLLVIASGLIAVVPGPNVIAYYLIFRLVSHYFSLMGARRGLRRDMWTTQASAELSAVGAALSLPIIERDARIDDAARGLGLERLTAFVRRVAPAHGTGA